MSSDTTDVLKNTEDISAAGDETLTGAGSQTEAEAVTTEKQAGAETIRAGAAPLDVGETGEIPDAGSAAADFYADDTADVTAYLNVAAVRDADENGDADADGAAEGAEETGAGDAAEGDPEAGMTIRKELNTGTEDGQESADGGDPEGDPDGGPAKTAKVEKAGSGEDSGEEQEQTDSGEGAGETDADEDSEEKEAESEEIKEIKQRIRERKREKKRKARRRRTLIWVTLLTIALTIGGFLFSISGFFTVDSIEVQGNSHFTAEEIINIAHAVPGHNLLYNPDKKTITDYLEQNPYIKSATVMRKLPSTLVISVHEREEAISFSYDDDFLIMDDEGILLKKTRTEPKITRVTGLVVTKIRLGDTVGTENQQMFSRLLRLVRAMKEADLYFVSIDMTGYENDGIVRAYIYDKLVVKSDYESLMTNLKNGRLHKIVEKLFEDDIKRGTITFGEDGSASYEPGI